MTRRLLGLALAVATIAGACGGDSGPNDRPDESGTELTGDDCILRIHGRSASGAPDRDIDGVVEVAPSGNVEFDPGWEWRYETAARYDEALVLVTEAVDDSECARIVVNGHSNGGAFTAKLLCSGETFGDRVVGWVVDDPVTDAATVGCTPGSDAPVTLYWTGALDEFGPPGTSCTEISFTCEGLELIGIEAMAANLGVAIMASPFDEHLWFVDAPEVRAPFG